MERNEVARIVRRKARIRRERSRELSRPYRSETVALAVRVASLFRLGADERADLLSGKAVSLGYADLSEFVATDRSLRRWTRRLNEWWESELTNWDGDVAMEYRVRMPRNPWYRQTTKGAI